MNRPTETLKYLAGYPPPLLAQVDALLERGQLGPWLLKKYPRPHDISSAKALYGFTVAIKNQYMRQSAPLAKVSYDDTIQVIQHALGLHSYVSRVQGAKLKAKNEIRIASVFKRAPEAFLRMIVVHELAHFKEKQHNKAFYNLCQHMEPDYHQLELDLRLYLTYRDQVGELY